MNRAMRRWAAKEVKRGNAVKQTRIAGQAPPPVRSYGKGWQQPTPEVIPDFRRR